jgi:hypothetical protein
VQPDRTPKFDDRQARAAHRHIYLLRLEARSGSASLRGLRHLLKRIGRYYGLKCIGAREVRRDPHHLRNPRDHIAARRRVAPHLGGKRANP